MGSGAALRVVFYSLFERVKLFFQTDKREKRGLPAAAAVCRLLGWDFGTISIRQERMCGHMTVDKVIETIKAVKCGYDAGDEQLVHFIETAENDPEMDVEKYDFEDGALLLTKRG